jgi:type II secretory ATPase GspE/PulE/Tfp pilus assembly ATPase PilB-like protein
VRNSPEIPAWVLSCTHPSDEALYLSSYWQQSWRDHYIPIGNIGIILTVAVPVDVTLENSVQHHPCLQAIRLQKDDYRLLQQEYQGMCNNLYPPHGRRVLPSCDVKRGRDEAYWKEFFRETVRVLREDGVIGGDLSATEDIFLAHVLDGLPVVDLSRVSTVADPPGLGTFLSRHDAVMLRSCDGVCWIAIAGVPDTLFMDRLHVRMEGRRYAVALTDRQQVIEARRNVARDAMGQINPDQESIETVWVLQREDAESENIQQPDVSTEARLRYVLTRALLSGASDIHVEEGRVRIRKDGSLIPLLILTDDAQRSLVSVLKGVAGMDQANFHIRQDGSFALRLDSNWVNVRVSAVPVSNHSRLQATQKLVLRLLPKDGVIYGKLENLGFSEQQITMLRHAISRPQGLILITGPTGSGKTTTIYSLLGELAVRDYNIITLEDPIEYELENINQTQLDPLRGMTIQEFRKGYVRQDPDILFLGEIRDSDTARLAMESSLTGHLVISTLHTESATGAIHRLMSLGVHAEILSHSLLLLQAQRLVKRLCSLCRRKRVLENEDKVVWKDRFSTRGLQCPDVVYEPTGCSRCQGTGYSGRVVLMEMVPVTRKIAQAIASSRVDNLFGVDEEARRSGFPTLYEDALRRVVTGEISLSQADLYGDTWEIYECKKGATREDTVSNYD